MPVIAASPKEKIICAAERLFADYGIENVSLRQIGVAAGNSNNSAVQYHFGSKEQLIDAIFEYRHQRFHERHALLLAERRPDNVRWLIESLLRAVLEQSELEDSHYRGFIAMLVQHGRWDVFERHSALFADSMRSYYDRLRSLLPQIDEPLRSHRIAEAMKLIVHAASDRERARRHNQQVLPLPVELGNLLDGMVAFLEAPVSAASRAAVEAADPAKIRWRMFL